MCPTYIQKFRHLRVTCHVTAPCCLHSTTSHQLSSNNCCFVFLSVETMWSARHSQDVGKSAVPLTLRMRSQLRAMQRAQAKAVAVLPQKHHFGFTSVALGPDLFATDKVPSSVTQTSGAVGDWVPFAPTSGAQSAGPLDHSTNERTSLRADLDFVALLAVSLSPCLVRALQEISCRAACC